MDFLKKIQPLWDQQKFVCVGLDPDIKKIPQIILQRHKTIQSQILEFNKAIIDATADLVCCYKPNSAFYEKYGVDGWEALVKTTDYLKSKYSHIPILLDSKRGDIENTNEGYVTSAFDIVGADAVTIQPYQGGLAVHPFLNRRDKMTIVLVKTSNKGSDEFQNLKIGKKFLYEIVAEKIVNEWNMNKNCGVVVGATYPEEMKRVRKIVGDMPILIPGVGSQGGDLKATIHAGKNSKNQGMIINSSRGILYASSDSDFVKAARNETLRLSEEIRHYLNE